MTNIFASISGHFGKALVLGAFLPATIFMILWSVFIEPIYPAFQTLLEPMGIFSSEWLLLAGLFIIIVITGLLNTLNNPIIRFYEGYPWKDSSLGKQRKKRYQEAFRQATDRRDGMRTLLRALDRGLPEFEKLYDFWNKEGVRLKNRFPSKESDILPTRLGNVIRSFERYPDWQYGIESILLWPRLLKVIDKEYLGMISDAKISVDFMLNSSVLNGLLAFSITVLALIYPQNTLGAAASLVIWLLEVAMFSLLAYLFYLGAISRAAAWGEMVKSAFDLYRWDLLESMGYQQKPQTRQAERRLWDEISVQMIYGDHPERGPRLDYVDLKVPERLPTAYGKDTSPALSISRGVDQPPADQVLQVVLEIKNPDKSVQASDVIVTDLIPDGYDYLWGSACVSNRTVQEEGTNPYRFHIGNLEPEEVLRLSYQVVRRVVD